MLVKQGITQEQLDMVDKGDLVEAKMARKELETDAAALPATAQEVVAKEKNTLTTKLKGDETASLGAIKGRRKTDLGKTGVQQQKAKTDLEKKRSEVTGTINGLYKTCQQLLKN